MDGRANHAEVRQLALVARDALEEYGLRRYEISEAVALLAVFTTFAVTACVLRLLAIPIRQRPIGLDDWSMLVAFLSMIGITVTSAIGLHNYNGLFTGQTGEADFLKTIFTFELLGSISVSFVKISILFLYLRIARKTRTPFWWSTMSMLGIVTLMTVVTVVMCFAQCTPFSHMFDLTGPGTCLDMTEYYYVIAAYLVASDIAIAAMPVPMLWALKKPTRERAVLVALFAMMLVPVIVSIARSTLEIEIGHLSSTKIGTKISLRSMELSIVELDLGIACACIPSIKALIAPRRPSSQQCPSQPRSLGAEKSGERQNTWRSKLESMRLGSTAKSAEDGTLELIRTNPSESEEWISTKGAIPGPLALHSSTVESAGIKASTLKSESSIRVMAI